MVRAYSVQQRQGLKASLWHSRGKLTKGEWTPICAYCGKEISQTRVFASGADMHEAILTRGDVQGCSDEVKQSIMVRFNCVLVHKECHSMAGTKDGLRRCIIQLLHYEGYKGIIRWLANLDLKTDQAKHAIRLVTEVLDEVQSMQDED